MSILRFVKYLKTITQHIYVIKMTWFDMKMQQKKLETVQSENVMTHRKPSHFLTPLE